MIFSHSQTLFSFLWDSWAVLNALLALFSLISNRRFCYLFYPMSYTVLYALCLCPHAMSEWYWHPVVLAVLDQSLTNAVVFSSTIKYHELSCFLPLFSISPFSLFPFQSCFRNLPVNWLLLGEHLTIPTTRFYVKQIMQKSKPPRSFILVHLCDNVS